MGAAVDMRMEALGRDSGGRFGKIWWESGRGTPSGNSSFLFLSLGVGVPEASEEITKGIRVWQQSISIWS